MWQTWCVSPLLYAISYALCLLQSFSHALYSQLSVTPSSMHRHVVTIIGIVDSLPCLLTPSFVHVAADLFDHPYGFDLPDFGMTHGFCL